jgi:cobalt-zinc-cadmium resistance protein CzcA
MNRELEKMPGVIWNFSQPISDNVEEAVSGVKGELAVKLYGDDLKLLEQKSDQIEGIMSQIPGVQDLGIFRVIGQPNLNYVVDRQPLRATASMWLTCRMLFRPRWAGARSARCCRARRATTWWFATRSPIAIPREAIEDIRLLAPSGERVSLAQLTQVKVEDGAEEIYREVKTSATSRSSTAFAWTRSGQHRGGSDCQGQRPGKAAPWLPP